MAKAQKLRSCASSDINKNKHIDQTILILFVPQGFPLIFAVTYQNIRLRVVQNYYTAEDHKSHH